MSVSKVNRKERIRPFLFVCFILPLPLPIFISLSPSFFLSLFSFLSYFIIIFILYFFREFFFHVPGCSGMFGVPGYIDALIWCKCLLRNCVHSKIFNLSKYREEKRSSRNISTVYYACRMPNWIWHQLRERLTYSFFKLSIH